MAALPHQQPCPPPTRTSLRRPSSTNTKNHNSTMRSWQAQEAAYSPATQKSRKRERHLNRVRHGASPSSSPESSPGPRPSAKKSRSDTAAFFERGGFLDSQTGDGTYIDHLCGLELKREDSQLETGSDFEEDQLKDEEYSQVQRFGLSQPHSSPHHDPKRVSPAADIVADLRRQLTAMAAERDGLRDECDELRDACARLSGQNQALRQSFNGIVDFDVLGAEELREARQKWDLERKELEQQIANFAMKLIIFQVV
ncbi:hypothetical protein HMN09_00261600 [Mycena chlorophos]|uniref:Uncharacterized protein n=1 Tax=Mycena chlorophos TaxID=658473 RepID=A0A8H6TM56_MYCCL|nr:hypothetical protein HMN09_00261600 [Mycena chlorophos]